MTINGRKVRLKKNIRRALAFIQAAAIIALIGTCAVIMFFWSLGIDLVVR